MHFFNSLASNLAFAASSVAFAGDAVPLSATAPAPWHGRQYPLIADRYHARLSATNGVRIAPWRGDRRAAFSLIFDDGTVDHVALAAPILTAAGLRASFAINPGLMLETKAQRRAVTTAQNPGRASWEEWQQALADGHELINHGWRHRGAVGDSTTAASLIEEVLMSQRHLHERTGAPCVAWVSGFNRYSSAGRQVVQQSHLVWRNGTGFAYGNPGLPASEATATAAAAVYAQRFAAQVLSNRDWTLSMAHGIDANYQPMGEDTLRQHAAFLAQQRDQVWIDTAGVIARYAIQAVSSTVAVSGHPGDLRIVVSDDLMDARLFDQPLTVVIAADQPSSVRVERAGIPISATVSANAIMIDVRPSSAAVSVRWREPASISSP